MTPAEIWELARLIVGGSMIFIGLFFVLAGAIGLLRLPDFYTRMHAASLTDTLGAELALLGMAIIAGFTLLAAKLLLVAVFLFLTCPTAAHALAHVAHSSGLKPLLGRFHPSPPAEEEPRS